METVHFAFLALNIGSELKWLMYLCSWFVCRPVHFEVKTRFGTILSNSVAWGQLAIQQTLLKGTTNNKKYSLGIKISLPMTKSTPVHLVTLSPGRYKTIWKQCLSGYISSIRQKFNRKYRGTKSRNLLIIYMYISKHSGVLWYRHRSHIDKNNLSLALLFSLNELKQRISGLMMIMYGGRFGKKLCIKWPIWTSLWIIFSKIKGDVSGPNEFAWMRTNDQNKKLPGNWVIVFHTHSTTFI